MSIAEKIIEIAKSCRVVGQEASKHHTAEETADIIIQHIQHQILLQLSAEEAVEALSMHIFKTVVAALLFAQAMSGNDTEADESVKPWTMPKRN